jgi:D-sedoheptulose 7-phosphate isomerase
MTETRGLSSRIHAAFSASSPSSQRDYVPELIKVLQKLPNQAINAIVLQLIAAYERGSSVYLFGNGGSAALASHAACDLGKGTSVNGNRRFRVLSLTDNIPLITAWANDARYEDIFAEQIRNFIVPGDISFAISASGNSPNVLNALAISRDLGGCNIGLTGFQGGKMKNLCDLCLVVPCDNMQHIEDSHLAVSHAVFTALRNYISALPVRASAVAATSTAIGGGVQ